MFVVRKSNIHKFCMFSLYSEEQKKDGDDDKASSERYLFCFIMITNYFLSIYILDDFDGFS